jgi:putative glutamine amidotransferase
MRPIIGVTGRVLKKRNGAKPKNLEVIYKHGGMPFIITNLDDRILNLCDGFLLPGGYNWNEIDHGIILHAKSLDKPLLGICLGMQAIVDLGLADTTVPNNGYIEHFQTNTKYAHQVMVNVDSKLGKIIGKEYINVNSRHNTQIAETSEIQVNAISEDGVVEGIELPNHKFIMGVQWHPEDLDDEASKKLFKEFIKLCT